MRAAVLKKPFKMPIEKVKKPTIGKNDVLIDVKATAICGTDLLMYSGKSKVHYPIILGHETTGEVSEIGENVETVSLGDRVVVDPVLFCGKCFWCKEGQTNICTKGGIIGREKNGAFAEYVSVPQTNVFRLPENLTYESGTIAQTLTTVIHSHRLVNIFPGNSVVILGLGIGGLLHVQLAKFRGANPVVGITRSQWKLDLARKLGADFTINAKEDITKKVKEVTNGRGADLVIEAVGSAGTLKECVDLVRPGGKILQFGISSDVAGDLSLYPFYFKELSVIGSRAATSEDWGPSISMIGKGIINVELLITHSLPFKDVEKGFKFFIDKSVKNIKIVITQ